MREELDKLKAEVTDIDIIKRSYLDMKTEKYQNINILTETVAGLSDEILKLKAELRPLRPG